MQASTNYIYIIFAVIYVIYSIIKAGKKVTQNRPTIDKQPQSSPTVQPPTATQPPQQDFKKMLEDLLGGNPDRPAEQTPSYSGEEKTPKLQIPKTHPLSHKSLPPKISKHTTTQKEQETAFQTKSLSARPHKFSGKAAHTLQHETAKKKSVPIKTVIAEPVVAEEPGMDFDIREAIIYSEILKRLEY